MTRAAAITPQEPSARIDIAPAEAFGDGRITIERAAFPWGIEYSDLRLGAFKFYELPETVRRAILGMPA